MNSSSTLYLISETIILHFVLQSMLSFGEWLFCLKHVISLSWNTSLKDLIAKSWIRLLSKKCVMCIIQYIWKYSNYCIKSTRKLMSCWKTGTRRSFNLKRRHVHRRGPSIGARGGTCPPKALGGGGARGGHRR